MVYYARVLLLVLFSFSALFQCKAKFRSVDRTGSGDGASDSQDANTGTDTSTDSDVKKIVFTANGSEGALSIDPNTEVTLEWSVQGYDSCTLSSLNLDGLTGTHSLGKISSNQTYTLTCKSSTGDGSSTVDIKMKVAPEGPTADLKVDGNDGPVTVNLGASVVVSWTSERATACTLNPGDYQGTSGSKTFANLSASVVYVLTCTGANGTTSDTVSVNVNTPPAPTGDFLVNGQGGPVYINSGSNLLVTWSSQNATQCTVTPGNFTGTSGSKTITNVTSSALYSLYCEGPGGTLSADVMVYINGTVVGTLDLKVNGQDGIASIPYGSDIALTWTSTNASTCEVISPFKKFSTLTGSETISAVKISQSILMVCTFTGGIPQYDYVTVVVESAPTPTVNIKANGQDDFLVVVPGDSVVLAWSSENAATCNVSPGNFSGTSGVQTVSNLTQTTAFVVTCSGAGGNIVDAVVVHVNTGGTPKSTVPTADLKINGVDGPLEVNKGATVTATWSSQDATQCYLTPSNTVGTSGSKSYTIQKQTLFILSCVGNGGTVTDMVTVRTTTGNLDPNTPRPSADLKVNGSDGPVRAYKGDNITLSWWSTNATSCVINPSLFSGVNGSNVFNNIQQTTVFILHCTGSGGDFIDQVTVNVDNGNLAPIADLKGNTSDGPLNLILGEKLRLTWTSQYANACMLYPSGDAGVVGDIDAGSPQQSRLYILVCKGTGGVTYDALAVNLHKPMPNKLSCSIYIHRSIRYGCGPNGYNKWAVWVQAVPPALTNGVDPSNGYLSLAKLQGSYGVKYESCNGGRQSPMPQTYTLNDYVYKLWTNGVAGSTDCTVYTTTVSPLIISFTTERMNLLPPFNGPFFDLDASGDIARYSWPADGAKHMFLVYDKNGDNIISSVDEMFGNGTTGPDGQKAANGFETLKKYDANKDKMITMADPIYHRLKLWADVNSNGITDPGELFTLASKSIRSINLNYKNGMTRLDEYGNESKESSTIDLLSGRSLPIVDYWFVAGPSK